MGLTPPVSTEWIADSGASFHTTPHAGQHRVTPQEGRRRGAAAPPAAGRPWPAAAGPAGWSRGAERKVRKKT